VLIAAAAALMVCLPQVGRAEPMGTAFAYQGRLIDANDAAEGVYDFNFGLYDSANDGNQVGSDVNVADVDVIDGYFTVELDFGVTVELDFGAAVFNGDARWLGIGVRPGDMNDPNVYTTLSPRQEVTPAPYALYAGGDGDWTISGNDMYSTVPGNVGIGIASPSAKLDVRSSRDATDPGLKVSRYLPLPHIGHTRMEIDSDSIDTYRYQFPAQTSGVTLGLNSNSGGNVILAGGGGNVGIRTSNPLSKLSVGADGFAGVAVYGSGSTYGLYGSSSSVGVHGVDTDTGSYGRLGSGDYGVYGSGSTYGMYGSGQIGVNGEGSWGVLGLGSFGGVAGTDSDTGSYGRLGYDDFGGYFDGNGYFSGNVGIGTASPGAGLHLKGTGFPNSFMYLESDANEDTGFRLIEDTDVKWHIFNSSTDGGLEIRDSNYSLALFAGQDSGNVGIGTTTPSEKLQVEGNIKATGSRISFGSVEYIEDAGSNLISTGGSSLHVGGNVGIGTTDPSTELEVAGTARVDVIQIMGADVAEKFPVSEEVKPGMVVAIDLKHPGKLCLGRGSYNRCVAGIVSGAGDLQCGAVLGHSPDNQDAPAIALTGRVWTYCDATNQPIEPGDLLTTSDRPGHAMKATDYTKAQGAILGKAMSSLEKGKGLVLVLVSLQ
jgi:hypothetical protein